LEGDDARQALADAGRQTTSRRDLARHRSFGAVSPALGTLDEAALEEALGEDADETLAMLADLTGATDARLRALARRLAGRVTVRLGRGGPLRERGTGRLRRVRLNPDGELDVEASLEALVSAAATGRPADVEDLRGTVWGRPAAALCLVVDRSGSVGGERLATAALAAAAVAARAPDDHSVVAVNHQAIVIKPQDQRRPVADVIDDVLTLRGHGPTDLALGLGAARAQLDRSSAVRRLTVLLSDGRPTAGDDPVAVARRLGSLAVLAPADDADEARAFAAAAGARFEQISGPSDIPRALRLLAEG